MTDFIPQTSNWFSLQHDGRNPLLKR